MKEGAVDAGRIAQIIAGDPRIRHLAMTVNDIPVHEHDWERGIHMAEAFGVDGRRYACAICGLERRALEGRSDD